MWAYLNAAPTAPRNRVIETESQVPSGTKLFVVISASVDEHDAKQTKSSPIADAAFKKFFDERKQPFHSGYVRAWNARELHQHGVVVSPHAWFEGAKHPQDTSKDYLAFVYEPHQANVDAGHAFELKAAEERAAARAKKTAQPEKVEVKTEAAKTEPKAKAVPAKKTAAKKTKQ